MPYGQTYENSKIPINFDRNRPWIEREPGERSEPAVDVRRDGESFPGSLRERAFQ